MLGAKIPYYFVVRNINPCCYLEDDHDLESPIETILNELELEVFFEKLKHSEYLDSTLPRIFRKVPNLNVYSYMELFDKAEWMILLNLFAQVN